MRSIDKGYVPRPIREARRWRCGAAFALMALAAVTLPGCGGKTEIDRLNDAEAMLMNNQILPAMIAFEKFIKKFPESTLLPRARFGLATTYMSDRDYASARSTLGDLLVSLDPADDEALGAEVAPARRASRVRAHLMISNSHESERDFGKALEAALETNEELLAVEDLNLRYSGTLYIGGLYYRAGQTGESLAWYGRMLDDGSLTPEDGVPTQHMEPLRRMAAIHLTEDPGKGKEKDLEAAVAVYEDYITEDTHAEMKAELYKMLGSTLRAEDESERASGYYTRAIELYKARLEEAVGTEATASLLLRLADTYRLEEEFEDAKAALRKIIEEHQASSSTPKAMRLLAETHYDLGEYETALGFLSALIEAYQTLPVFAMEVQLAYQRAQIIQNEMALGGPTTRTLRTRRVPAADDRPSTEALPGAAADPSIPPRR